MSNYDDDTSLRKLCFAYVGGLILGGIIGAVFTSLSVDAVWKHESVERGFAHYNSQNGDWEWMEIEKNE